MNVEKFLKHLELARCCTVLGEHYADLAWKYTSSNPEKADKYAKKHHTMSTRAQAHRDLAEHFKKVSE